MSRLSWIPASLVAMMATGALAQGGNSGFFPPTPDGDVALTKIVPPKKPVDPSTRSGLRTQSADSGAKAPAIDAQQAATIVREREEALRKAEEDLDRAEREADQARRPINQASAPIQGAFTGLTSERDR